MIVRRHHQWVLAVALFAFSVRFASAQVAPVDPSMASAGVAEWPGKYSLIPGRRLHVGAVSSATRRQNCTIVTLDAAQLTCARHFGRKPRIFRDEDVLALIRPGAHDPANTQMLAVLGLEAGLITGAVFLAPVSLAGAIALGVTGSVFNLLLLVGIGMAAGEVAPPDLLYLRPGEQLRVALK
jgi:hypothetical protein